MKLDNEQQGQMLLQLINAAQIPGNAIEAVFDLKMTIGQALADLKKPEAEHVDDRRPT
jgi:hypothetical protein